MNLKGRHVLVLGMGETGISIVKWLSRQEAIIRVADSRAAPPHLDAVMTMIPAGEIFTGPFESRIFEAIEIIAMSPGVPLSDPHVQQAISNGIPVVGDIALFRWALEQNNTANAKVLAITGTNGKTTVTAMVGAMLKKAGLDVAVAGNIGPAVLDVFMQRLDSGKMPQMWVLEVSSFQLELTEWLNADVAAVLNLSEDHMDRYRDMQEYIQAKARIFNHEKPARGMQILNRDDVLSLAMRQTDRKQVTFGLSEPDAETNFGIAHRDRTVWLMEGGKLLMKTSDLKLNGLHNTANALAALAICRAVEMPVEPLLSALREFKGLPHRMEVVAAFCEVTFIDDSKSTNVGSTVAALNGLQGNVVLIAGGDGKGQDFTLLRQAVAEGARAVVLIGRDAGKIAAALSDCGVPVQFAQTMEDALQKSFLLAHSGDVVLLSPACASFDMFRNYVHRAEVFVAAVRDIELKCLTLGEKRH
ncbi:MAG: UDP-N-acetylmuramoyl-L-alanine--D-glutamate ligase [Nitrosomonas sp.]|nr:UDP-N-acetylmuramoyl-L-alanine--D-glutamate ligase [Nitrosomonas sp.]